MKISAKFLIAPILAVLFAGCSSHPPADSPDSEQTGALSAEYKNGKKYAIVFPIAHPFFESISTDAQNYGEENGWDIIIKAPDSANAQLQVEIMEELIFMGVDGIAIGPTDPHELVGSINKALDTGIKVICFETDAPGSNRMGYVGTNNYNAGRHMGYVVGKALGGKGRILILTGLSTQMSLNERIRGIKEYLAQNYPDIQILDTQSSEGDAQKAIAVTKNMIRTHPNFDAIVGIDATAGPAAVSVWKAKGWHGRPDKKIITFDDMPENLQGMRDGYIKTIVSQRQNSWGQGVLILLNSLVEGRAIPDYTDTGSIEITMSNIDWYFNQPSWVEPR